MSKPVSAEPLTNLVADAIEGYKAGLAGEPMGFVSAAFDCGWYSGNHERADPPVQPVTVHTGYVITGGHVVQPVSAEPPIADFVAKQKHLPPDVQKVIADNMSKLYDGEPPVQPVSAEPCPLCNGTGRVDRPSFADTSKMIEKSCSACHGKGIIETLAQPPATEQDVAEHMRLVDEYREGSLSKSKHDKRIAVLASARKLAGLNPAADLTTVAPAATPEKPR